MSAARRGARRSAPRWDAGETALTVVASITGLVALGVAGFAAVVLVF